MKNAVECDQIKYRGFDLIIYQDASGYYWGEAHKNIDRNDMDKSRAFSIKEKEDPDDVESILMDGVDRMSRL